MSLGDEPPKRQSVPHEDDLLISRLEVEFALPTYIPGPALMELDGLLSSIVRLRQNQLEGHIHWVSGSGAKPIFSKADSRFLGKSVADDAKESGEPSFDDSVCHFETSIRMIYPGEESKYQSSGQLSKHLADEVNAAHSLLDKLNAPKTKIVNKRNGAGTQEITLRVAERINLIQGK